MARRTRSASPNLHDYAVAHAMHDALYHKFVDECWEAIKEVLDDPKVQKVRQEYFRLLVETMARKYPHNGGKSGK